MGKFDHRGIDGNHSASTDNYSVDGQTWKEMQDRDGIMRAARHSLEIFRANSRAIAFLGLAALGAWPIVKLCSKLNDQNAQQNSPAISADAFVQQLSDAGDFKISQPNGRESSAKYVMVAGYLSYLREKATDGGKSGVRVKRWYAFEPATQALLTQEAALNQDELTNTTTTNQLNQSLFPTTNKTTQLGTQASDIPLVSTQGQSSLGWNPDRKTLSFTNTAGLNILVTTITDELEEFAHGSDAGFARDSRRLPVTIQVSKAEGFHQTKSESNAGKPGTTNTVHYLRALSTGWGHEFNIPPQTTNSNNSSPVQSK